MTIFSEPEEHFIADCYLSALINGDYSSFDYYYSNEDECQKEIKRFDDWVEEAQAGRQGHWSCPDGDDTDFVICEIGGLRASCVEVTFHPIKE